MREGFWSDGPCRGSPFSIQGFAPWFLESGDAARNSACATYGCKMQRIFSPVSRRTKLWERAKCRTPRRWAKNVIGLNRRSQSGSMGIDWCACLCWKCGANWKRRGWGAASSKGRAVASLSAVCLRKAASLRGGKALVNCTIAWQGGQGGHRSSGLA